MLGRLFKSVMLKNVIFVYALQASNLLLSFVTAPYLARTLDVSGYGAFSYCMSTNAFLWIVVDWGYGVGAVREVAMSRDDPGALKAIFWRALSGRALLALPAVLLLLVLAYVGRANDPIVVITSGLLTIAGAVIACDWFVQGVERMGIYLATSVAARALGFALTLILVHRPHDIGIAAAIHGFSGLLVGMFGFTVVWSAYRMGRLRLSFAQGFAQVWAFRHYFIARSNSLLYVSAAPVILGVASSATALGIFAGADKIVRISVLIVTPLSVALAARVNNLMASSRSAAGVISGRVLLLHLAVTAPMAVVLFLFADQLSDLVLGPSFHSSAGVIRLLSPLPVLMGVNGCLAGQFLVPLGRARSISRTTLVSSVFYVISLAILGYTAGAAGAAASLLFAEFCLAAGFAGVLIHSERPYLAMALAGLRGKSR